MLKIIKTICYKIVLSIQGVNQTNAFGDFSHAKCVSFG